MTDSQVSGLAQQVVEQCVERQLTVATAESLTGGLVAGALTSVPGASRVVRGAVVAYATDIKASVLGVDATLLATVGAIDERVAVQMAAGVARLLGADLGLACTGVAGPDPQDGHDPGLVWLALSSPEGVKTQALSLTGDRHEIRAATVRHALNLVLSSI